MRFSLLQRSVWIVIATSALIGICAGANAQSFDQMLGNFAQKKSGTCVLYAHIMAVAEYNPEAFAQRVHEVYGGWMAYFSDGRRTYVAKEEVETSLLNGYSSGDPNNILTVYSIAVCKRSAGFDATTGKLDYGEMEWLKFLTSDKWIGYGEDQGLGYKVKDGLKRIADESKPTGRIRIPCTIAFGILNEATVPKYIDQIKQYKVVGVHDFQVVGFNFDQNMVRMRDPHKPKDIIDVPVSLILSIPCGIDFMVPSQTN